MDRTKIAELRQQIKKLHTDWNALPSTTAEERAVIGRMIDDSSKLQDQVDLLERAGQAEARFGLAPGRTAPPSDPLDATDPGNDDAEVKKRQERYHQAYINYLKFGEDRKMRGAYEIRGLTQEDKELLYRGSKRIAVALQHEDRTAIADELRSMGAVEGRDMGSGGQGAYPGATTGFFVPVGFVNRIEEALKYYGPMLRGGPGMPEIMDTATGQPLPFPTDNDTTVTGELIGEGQQVTTADVSLGQIILGAYKYSSKLVKVSIELLQDSAFDLETYLVNKFGIRLGRILNTHMTTGSGTSQPKGIVTASTAGPAAIGTALNDGTSASTNTVGSDDLINLEHSVDILYRPGAKFMMHDNTLKAIKNVKDKYGRPLWLPGLAVTEPSTINGYQYEINNDMDQLQTVATSPVVVRNSVLFGQLSKYVVRRVKEMAVLRLEERFADWSFSPAI